MILLLAERHGQLAGGSTRHKGARTWDAESVGAAAAAMANAGMHDRLREILDAKKLEIEALAPKREELRRQALLRDDFRGFARALAPRDDESIGLIAEIKKASPSVGVIAEEFDPAEIARRYEAAGAQAISVLTDEKFFQGHLSYLGAVREACSLPLLRKDFILDEIQIFEAVCAGADAILLIAAALPPGDLDRLQRVARDFQLDVLVEVHTLAEMERAVDAGADLIGINNRDLTTFVVDLETTNRLADEAPEGIILVSESGIKTGADAMLVAQAGADAILVGETLMRCGESELAAKVGELRLT